jgi:hypothetical protein
MCDGAYGVDAALMSLELHWSCLNAATMLMWGCLMAGRLVLGARERDLRSAWVTQVRGIGRQDSLAWALAWERSVC